MIASLVVTCAGCAATRTCPATPAGAPRTPRGWKVVADAALCATCLASRYQIRAITVPVSGPLEATWAEFGACLRQTWIDTTRAANWIATELYARDVRREPGDVRLRPMPRVYLYPEVRVAFPALTPINLTALIQQVEQTYRHRRYELLWQRAISLSTYRYPVPAPIHAQAWRLEQTPGGAIVAHVRLGDRWWALRLRGGPHFHRQRLALQQLAAGVALPAAGALYAIAATGDAEGDARHAERGQRVMLKLVAWLPRAPRSASATVATVQTGASDLLMVRVPHRGIVLTVSGDHLRRAIRSYDTRIGRLVAELGVARRWIPAERRAVETRLQVLRRRQHPAMRTWLQQIAASVARAAASAGAGAVRYEDEAREFCDPFPWQALRLALAHAVEGRGLGWQYASGATGPTDEGIARIEGCVAVSA